MKLQKLLCLALFIPLIISQVVVIVVAQASTLNYPSNGSWRNLPYLIGGEYYEEKL
jgi:hypothetical protein